MKSKSLFVCLLALSCAFTTMLAAGCSDDETESMNASADHAETSTHTSKISRGLTAIVDFLTGDMQITRPENGEAGPDGSEEKHASSDDPWTIYIYLCGSDLESLQASATDDLIEMTNVSDAENVRFIIEAGGTSEWQNDTIDADQIERIVIQDGDVESAGTLDQRNMGDGKTLAEFLTWALSEYPSDRSGVVFWDHGGGSVNGVCMDENYDGDTLSLKEIDAAFLSAYGSMDQKFDFIGFDACLMGTLETANIAASYADYLYASEETEPGTGWDYAGIAAYLADNPNSSGADLGKAVCDTYYEASLSDPYAEITTFSVIDLSKVDDVVKSFNTFSRELCEASADASALGEIIRNANEADNYGGNNRSDGYSNMVDLRGLAEACSDHVASSDTVVSALDDAVVYKKAGSAHERAGGLSVYYPLSVQDANELAVLEQVCVSPYYLTFVDTIERTSAQDAMDSVFDTSSFFDGDNWEWSSDYDYDDDTGWFGYDSDTLNEEYWSYENDSETTGESPLITFDVEPELDEDGYFGFVLSEDALKYSKSVSAYVYEVWDDDMVIELGETCDIVGDWSSGAFIDNFDGTWLSLPDGQNLATYVAERTDDYVVYSSPILLNGKETCLRIRYDLKSGDVIAEGAWDGVGESGIASRIVQSIEKGDVITPQYYSADNESDETDIEGEDYKVGDDLEVDFSILCGYEYDYCFIIDDIYGDYYMTDPAYFEVDDDGNVLFSV